MQLDHVARDDSHDSPTIVPDKSFSKYAISFSVTTDARNGR